MKMKLKMAIFAKWGGVLHFAKMIIFQVILDSFWSLFLKNEKWKWAENGPKMATVNNPIVLLSPLFSDQHVGKSPGGPVDKWPSST